MIEFDEDTTLETLWQDYFEMVVAGKTHATEHDFKMAFYHGAVGYLWMVGQAHDQYPTNLKALEERLVRIHTGITDYQKSILHDNEQWKT